MKDNLNIKPICMHSFDYKEWITDEKGYEQIRETERQRDELLQGYTKLIDAIEVLKVSPKNVQHLGPETLRCMIIRILMDIFDKTSKEVYECLDIK